MNCEPKKMASFMSFLIGIFVGALIAIIAVYLSMVKP